MRDFEIFDDLIDKKGLNKFFLYLFRELNIDPDLNESIDIIIDDKDNTANETLEALLELCISNCAPYLYHPILTRYGILIEDSLDEQTDYGFPLYNDLLNKKFEKHLGIPFFQSNKIDKDTIFYADSYLQSEYTNYLKEHLAVSFYYSTLLLFNNDLIKNIEGEKNINTDLVSSKFFSYLKFIENTALAKNKKIEEEDNDDYNDQLKSYNYRVDKYKKYISDNVKLEGKKRNYINLPNYLSDNLDIVRLVDFSLISSLASKTPNNPYDKNSCLKKSPYSYNNFHKFINGLDDIVLQKKEFPATSKYKVITSSADKKYLSTETEILYNNYLLERLFHFDFISFLIKQYTTLIGKNDELNNVYKKLFMELSSLAILPNIFSRNYMAEKFLNSYINATKDIDDMLKINNILENWTIDIRYFQTYLLNCVFPILNTTFLYIMSYVFNKKDANIKEFCELFDKCIGANKKSPHLNIYEKYPNSNTDKKIANYIKKKEDYTQNSDKKNIKPPKLPKYYSIYSINSHIRGKLINDKHDLFQLIYKNIFYQIMSRTQIQPILPYYGYNSAHPEVCAERINFMTNIFK